jgi:hypothetical protein
VVVTVAIGLLSCWYVRYSVRLPTRPVKHVLDAVDALGEAAAGEVLRRLRPVALDPDRGERRVRVTEGELAHLLGGDPLATEVLAARTVGVVDEDLETVLPLSGPQQRDGMPDVTDPLQGRGSLDSVRSVG